MDKLELLSEAHLEELAHLAPTMQALWRAVEQSDGQKSAPTAVARP
jgi:hypothetical protein